MSRGARARARSRISTASSAFFLHQERDAQSEQRIRIIRIEGDSGPEVFLGLRITFGLAFKFAEIEVNRGISGSELDGLFHRLPGGTDVARLSLDSTQLGKDLGISGSLLQCALVSDPRVLDASILGAASRVIEDIGRSWRGWKGHTTMIAGDDCGDRQSSSDQFCGNVSQFPSKGKGPGVSFTPGPISKSLAEK